MYRKLYLLLNFWIVFISESKETGVVPPPRNVTLERNGVYFCLRLSWSSPEGLNETACTVNYEVEEYSEYSSEKPSVKTRVDMYVENCLGLESGVTYSVKTRLACPDRPQQESEPVVLSIPPPKEPKIQNFNCFYYSSEAMNCTWDAMNQTEGLQLFYWYQGLPELKPCPMFLYHGDMKWGCHLRSVDLNHNNCKPEIFFFLNGTLGKHILENSFQKEPLKCVKAPPLNLQIEKRGNRLLLKWDHPKLFDKECWDYQYRYKINKHGVWQVFNISKTTEDTVAYDQRYEYTAQVKAIFTDRCGSGGSDWSLEKRYGQNQDWSLHVALITVPILVTAAVIISLLFFKKLRKLILPEIPDPRVILKDWLSDNDEKMERMLPEIFVPCEDVCAKVNIVKEMPQL